MLSRPARTCSAIMSSIECRLATGCDFGQNTAVDIILYSLNHCKAVSECGVRVHYHVQSGEQIIIYS
jgi:hypothetical protein